MTATPCPVCGAAILKARLTDGQRVTLDATKTPTGTLAAWQHREGLNWLWHAREATPETWSGNVAYQLHDCQPAGQQMELTA